jgi:RHS repeat-associated protein
VWFNYDSTSWTRRLLTSYDGVPGNGSGGDVTQWTYDRFGNRLTELHSLPNASPEPLQYYTVGSDNRLLGVSDHIHASLDRRYLTDQAGQRLATLDNGTGLFGLWGVSTWTAAGQLYYSMTPETATGPYDHVWTWYDGSGRRFMTHLATTVNRALDGANPDSTVGFRTYYVYDGNDVAFTLVKPSSGTTWRIQQRYVNTGLDENVAARLWLNGTPTSLALVTDRQGGYIMGVKANGTEETSTGFYLRNAFGKMESGSTAAASLETHTGLGFAGAGTPTSAGGGYVYLRNRWYDPQTGRFLSQDPIGLAGGVNLYAYAGNNPASYSDPFGLCPDSLRANSDGECDRWNQAEADKAKQIVAEEAAAGNPHALPITMDVLGYNADKVPDLCRPSGHESHHQCNNSETIVVNADDGAPAIAAMLMHEEQHALGRRVFGKKSRQGGEHCANKRQSNFVHAMHNQGYKQQALQNKQINDTWNLNYPGCGF